MTVLQLIARAGGLSEYADAGDIGVVRSENGRTVRLKFNYKDVSRGRKIEQVELEEDGVDLVVDGCLECGTCRIVCARGNVDWNYPRGGFGILFKFG